MAKGESSGGDLGNGGGAKVGNYETTDIFSLRKGANAKDFSDDIIGSVRQIHDDFPNLMKDTVSEVVAYKFENQSVSKSTLGLCVSSNGITHTVGVNEAYMDTAMMNKVYDASVSSGYHPPRGNKTGTEAVMLHEMGHALTVHAGAQMGSKNIDSAARRIVNKAYKKSGGKGGTKSWAKKISKYATESNAECVAEAVADWYCNGSKASSQSKAIMSILNQYK